MASPDGTERRKNLAARLAFEQEAQKIRERFDRKLALLQDLIRIERLENERLRDKLRGLVAQKEYIECRSEG